VIDFIWAAGILFVINIGAGQSAAGFLVSGIMALGAIIAMVRK
jgi:hypothetical protein